MKISGVDPSTLTAEEVLVLPRREGDLVFKARGVKNYDEFDAICKAPTVPVKLTSKGKVDHVDEPNYVKECKEYADRRFAYLIVASLQDIEWDTVKLDKPGTWMNWENELRDAGLNEVEMSRVLALCMQANSLDESKLERARSFFLHSQAAVSGT